MGKSKIEWCDYTFNPWIGCTKVSEGCRNCYAHRDFQRKPRWANAWGDCGVRVRTSAQNWRKPLAWNDSAPGSVFCASLADVFDDHPSIQQSWRDDLWNLVIDTPNLEWLFLTKRPQNVVEMLPREWIPDLPSGVHLGFSASGIVMFNERMSHALLSGVPQWFVSAEPLLGRISFRSYEAEHIEGVIAGGESGPNARPTRGYDVEALANQCYLYDIPFFFKQWGEWVDVAYADLDYVAGNVEVLCWDALVKVGRYKSGRSVRGRTYDELAWSVGDAR